MTAYNNVKIQTMSSLTIKKDWRHVQIMYTICKLGSDDPVQKQLNPSCGHVYLQHLQTWLQTQVAEGRVLLKCGHDKCKIHHPYDMVSDGAMVLDGASRFAYEATMSASYLTTKVCFSVSLSIFVMFYGFVIMYLLYIFVCSLCIVHRQIAQYHTLNLET